MLPSSLLREIYTNSLKDQLNEETNKAAQGQIIMSRVPFYKGDGKSSIFLNLEKHYCEKKCIRQLKLDNDELMVDETKIFDYVAEYYQTLYKLDDTHVNYDLFDMQATKRDQNERFETYKPII